MIRSKIDGKIYIVVCTNELTYDIIEEHQSLDDYNPLNCLSIDHNDCEEL